MAVPAFVGPDYVRGGIAIMCEAPGRDEDEGLRPDGHRQGEPLVGRAGRKLDSLLEQVGLHRDELVLLNKVRCRPPGNNIADVPESILACDPWTVAELQAYDPSVVVLMGATALKGIFGADAKVGVTAGHKRETGPEHPYGQRLWIATYHPAAALRNRDIDPVILRDLQTAKDSFERG
jgi:uracil-DNA glycosylase